MSASWPLAKLHTSADALEISMGIAGAYRFEAGQVVGIEKRTLGIQIEHTRKDIAELVLFFSWRPQKLLNAIEQSGFRPGANPSDKPAERPFPFRATFMVVATLLWCGLILLDQPFSRPNTEKFIWGPGMFTALGLLFVGSVLIRRWGALQRFALTGPEAFTRIEPARRLVAFVSGALFVGGLAALLSQ
jgi:hypothetical protein